MTKGILFMEDLVKVFAENNIQKFDYHEKGQPIIVHTEQDFAESETESLNGKLYAKVRVCHTLLNRNGSYISEDVMKDKMGTLKDSPLLGYIWQNEQGEYDFSSHMMHIETHEDGEEELVYDERQIGSFTSDDPYLEYDEKMDKTYVVAKVAIPEEYTKAADIIRRKKGTKVSCELAVLACSYNAKDKYLSLDDFIFTGVTCLGTNPNTGKEIKEGMEGSKLTLEDFSQKSNTMFDYQLLEKVNEKIDSLLSRFNDIKSERKEEVEVEQEFENAEEEVTSTEEVTETEESTEEVTETVEESEAVDDTPNESENTSEEEFSDNSEEETTETAKFENMVRTYEISHEDIRYALYQLLMPVEEADNDWYFISAVYDDHFDYESWEGNKIFRQNYTKDENDQVAFDGERINMHRELLTDSEYAQLQSMRSNYESLVEFKANTEKKEAHSLREKVMTDEKYSVITNNDSYKELYKNMDNYSCEELDEKLKAIVGEFAMNGGVFQKDEKEIHHMKPFGTVSAKPKKRYGNLFD